MDRVLADVLILNEILGRQGSSLLLDAVAESCGSTANKFNMSKEERMRLTESVVNELKEAVLERV